MPNQFLTSLAVGDFNGDGVPDWVAADENTNTAGVMLSTAFKAVSPALLKFGSQGVSTASPGQAIIISNPSNVAFNVASVAVSDDFHEGNNCGASLAPGANCTVNVSFSPTTTGPESGTLTITDGTRSSPQAVPLSGTGVNGPFLTPSPGRLNFGAIAVGMTSVSVTTMLVNTGNAALGLTGISIAGADGSDFCQSNNCGSSLLAGASCVVSVKFTPSAGGARTASLSISDIAPGSPQLATLVVNGTAPVVSLSATSLTFASQTVGTISAPETVTVSNVGSAPLSITKISASGDFGVTNTCGTSLDAGNACQISVTFTPTASGNQSGDVSITDDGSGSPQTVTLSGTRFIRSLSLGVPSGSSSSATVSAGQPASYMLSIGGGGFSGTVSLTCTVAPTGATCSVPASENVSATTGSTFTVSVTTTSRTLAMAIPSFSGPTGWLWAVAIFGLVTLHGSSKRRRLHTHFKRTLPLGLLLVICSCGGGRSSGPQPNPNGTPAGKYTLTVTATSGSTTQSVPLTLTVQ